MQVYWKMIFILWLNDRCEFTKVQRFYCRTSTAFLYFAVSFVHFIAIRYKWLSSTNFNLRLVKCSANWFPTHVIWDERSFECGQKKVENNYETVASTHTHTYALCVIWKWSQNHRLHTNVCLRYLCEICSVIFMHIRWYGSFLHFCTVHFYCIIAGCRSICLAMACYAICANFTLFQRNSHSPMKLIANHIGM